MELNFTVAFLVLIEIALLIGIVMNMILGNWGQIGIYAILMILVGYLIWRRMSGE